MISYIYRNIKLASLILLLATGSSQVFGQSTACDSVNDELNAKFRFLGNWDANGTPGYMDPASDEVSQALINFVKNTLPETVNFVASNQDYFGDHIQLNTELKEASEVYLTMVHEGAGWKNTLGYYAYDLNNPPATVYDIDSLVILFPNVSQPDVIKPGDKIFLGQFPENTGIGYFLIAKGWVGDTICLASHMIFTDSHFNTYTTSEYMQQTILLSNEQENRFLLGFEDNKRPEGDEDFNDAVFYITATPGAIDTTDVAKVPTGILSGDTLLCDEHAPATIQVALTGKAPWTIVYNNGSEDVEISGIEEEVYTFETMIKDTIKLISVKDVSKFGIAEGEAVINFSNPKAILSEDDVICNDESSDSGGFIVSLEGEAPFSLAYRIGDEERTVDNIYENQLEIFGAIGQVIELISVTDKYCDGELVGGAVEIQNYAIPSLTIESNGRICGDNSAVFDLNLNGEGPWTLNYTIGDYEVQVPIETSEFQLNISDTGHIAFNSIANEHCSANLESSFNIEHYELPSAQIEDFESSCGDSKAHVDILLTGSGPWTVYYTLNGVDFVAESDENTLSLDMSEAGTFELTGVADANCENSAEGVAEIGQFELPAALISGGGVVCNEEEVTVSVELSGVAPFTFTYTDGETETTVTTDESRFEFSTGGFKTYTLLNVEDANCIGAVEGSVEVSDGSDGIQVEIKADEISCFSEDIELSLIGETDNMSIKWSSEGKGLLQTTDATSAIYTPAENETGSIVFYAEVNNGCAVKTISDEVTVMEQISAEFEVSPENDLLTNTQITFTPSNNGYDSYGWDFGDGNSSSATIASTEYAEGGAYTVELRVSLNGCEGSGSKVLEVFSKDVLYVPNAFNPNAQNSENQVVKVYGSNVDDSGFLFKIVNRWGKVMYETNSFDEANQVGWHGVNKNTSEELELNVFTYLLRGRFIEGSSFERTGTVTQVK
ncbi:MAG: DUF4114 domain-containing protein [Cytophagales bacterium]|nr:DUF4114 domain-containing protein [Cytophagales bacterium]